MDVMPLLIKMNQEDAGEFLEEFPKRALDKSTDAVVRHGVGMSLGAMVEGLYTQGMPQHSILELLDSGANGTKNGGVRYKALYVPEGLSLSLGKVTGPYVEKQGPLLLQAFSDGSTRRAEG